METFPSARFIVFSDASLNNLESGKSAGGFLICLVNDKGDSCPLFWKSKTLRRAVRSTLAAETTAMVDALDVGYYLSYCMSEILHNNTKAKAKKHAGETYACFQFMCALETGEVDIWVTITCLSHYVCLYQNKKI